MGSGPSCVAFHARLDAAIASARGDKGQVAVLHVADEVDTRRGQEAVRRRVLDVTLQRLKDTLRSRDALGRPSCDEPASSVALVSDSEISVALDALERPQDAYKIARRLQQHLAQPIDVDGEQVVAPTSMGIAVHPEDGLHSDELVASAIGAMQAAREEGKGLIRFARPAMNTVIFERLALETHLRHALERKELSVYYQPRVSIATGEVVSVEALLRWKHPELGMVSPAHFIPVAEESGLILPIGEWVLREACAQNRRWRDEGIKPIRMAVNLSPAQFREPDLMGIVRRALADAGMIADSLELELTESMLLQKADATVTMLHTMKDAGVHLSIDDFGTGYSSLNYIKRFPVDALKIDQSFIREMMTSEQDSTLTTSIILMGKGLNLTVVAEGVETRSQLEMLKALGCDEAQGYLFSRPVPASDAARLIARGFA
jgi:EAL domain-containing protein (putative c-di-GMP-specific phosphodiesterase class I)/GGDEF domain-containing protein